MFPSQTRPDPTVSQKPFQKPGSWTQEWKTDMFFPMSSSSEYPEISRRRRLIERMTPVESVSTEASLRQRRSMTDRSLAFSLRMATTSCLSRTFSSAKERIPCLVSKCGMASRTHWMTSFEYGRSPYPPSNDESADVNASDISLRAESQNSLSISGIAPGSSISFPLIPKS